MRERLLGTASSISAPAFSSSVIVRVNRTEIPSTRRESLRFIIDI